MTESVRFGLVWQFHPLQPGTPEQRAHLRAKIEEFGYGTERWRLLWYFARAYKARNDYVMGGLEGSRHHINISIDGSGNFAFSNALLLASWSLPNDLWLFFCHEWGHIFDEYVLTPEMRLQLMAAIETPHYPNWRGDPSDYWSQPNELFAWSFQRLVDPTLTDLPSGYSRDLLAEVLPNVDAAWVEAGLPIPND